VNAVSKYKNWMLVTNILKILIGQKISQSHLMLKSLGRAMLETPKEGG
jgi:hypothetical protein